MTVTVDDPHVLRRAILREVDALRLELGPTLEELVAEDSKARTHRYIGFKRHRIIELIEAAAEWGSRISQPDPPLDPRVIEFFSLRFLVESRKGDPSLPELIRSMRSNDGFHHGIAVLSVAFQFEQIEGVQARLTKTGSPLEGPSPDLSVQRAGGNLILIEVKAPAALQHARTSLSVALARRMVERALGRVIRGQRRQLDPEIDGILVIATRVGNDAAVEVLRDEGAKLILELAPDRPRFLGLMVFDFRSAFDFAPLPSQPGEVDRVHTHVRTRWRSQHALSPNPTYDGPIKFALGGASSAPVSYVFGMPPPGEPR